MVCTQLGEKLAKSMGMELMVRERVADMSSRSDTMTVPLNPTK